MVFTASLLGSQQIKRCVKKKPASLLVVSLGKTLNGTPPHLSGRQVAITVSVIIKNYKNQIKNYNRISGTLAAPKVGRGDL